MSKPSKNRTLWDGHDLHEPTDGYDCYEDMMDMIKLSLLAAMFDKAMMAMIKIKCFKKKFILFSALIIVLLNTNSIVFR